MNPAAEQFEKHDPYSYPIVQLPKKAEAEGRVPVYVISVLFYYIVRFICRLY